jgi:hypothetical protein
MFLALVFLAGCSHAGQPSRESSSQSEAKGALDDPGFLRRLFGQEPASEEQDVPVPKEASPDEGEAAD